MFECALCHRPFPNIAALRVHVNGHAVDPDFRIVDAVFRNAYIVYRKMYLPATPSLENTVQADMQAVIRIMVHQVMLQRQLKFNMVAMVEYIKLDQMDEVVQVIVHHVRSPVYLLTQQQDQEDIFRRSFIRIEDNVEDMLNSGSGWILNAVYRLDLEFYKIPSMSGSCTKETAVIYNSDVKKMLHLTVNGGKADCFYLALASFFTGKSTVSVNRKWLKLHRFETKDIPLPVPIGSINKFEDMNYDCYHFGIHVIAEEEGDYYPVFRSTIPNAMFYITLLLQQFVQPSTGRKCRRKRKKRQIAMDDIWEHLPNEGEDDEDDDDTMKCCYDSPIDVECHYVLARDLDKLLKKNYKIKRNNGDIRNRSYVRRFCPNCLEAFSSHSALKNHKVLCEKNEVQKIKMPSVGSYLEFTHYERRFKFPVIGFFDFEVCLSCITLFFSG